MTSLLKTAVASITDPVTRYTVTSSYPVDSPEQASIGELYVLARDYDRVCTELTAEAEHVKRLEDGLRALIRGYVGTLETARDLLVQRDYQCDSLETMESGDPYLRAAKALLEVRS